MREVWSLADDELRRELELDRIRLSEEQSPQSHHLSLADAVSSLLLVVDDFKESQDLRVETSTSHLSAPVDTTSSLEVRKVVVVSNGFNVALGLRKNRKDWTDMEHLRRVGICLGYITRDPPTLAVTRTRNAWSPPLTPIKMEQQHQADLYAGEVIIMLVDSRKNWNFPYGKACDVDIVWPSSTGRSKLFCELHVRQLRGFRTYKVTLKVDLDPLELFAGTAANISRRIFSFRHDIHELAVVTIKTARNPPDAPDYISAALLSGYESIDACTRRRTIRIDFIPGDPNGGDTLHYDVQRLVVLQSLHQNPQLRTMTWQHLATITPDSDYSYLDSEMVEPFVTQYRVRAVTDVGKGPYATTLEVTNASGTQLSVLDEYDDPLRSSKHDRTLPKKHQLSLRSADDGYDKLLGTILERKSKIKNNDLDEGDQKWLDRLARASPFGM